MQKKILNKLQQVEFIFLGIIIFSFLFEVSFVDFRIERLYNLLENSLFAILLILPFYYISSNRFKEIYFKTFFSIYSIFILLETSYYYIFKTNISASAIYIAFETNYQEASEFLLFYVDYKLIIFIVLVLAFLVKILFKRNYKSYKFNNLLINKTIGILIAISIIVLLKFSTLRHQNFPYLILKSFYVVYYESDILKPSSFENKKGIFEDAQIKEKDKGKLYVIIIGESTTSKNMSLYGYNRNTNPLLSSIPELLVYTNVISPHAWTTETLGKALSLRNYENYDTSKQGSIIQLLNASGFQTYWISNQQPVGFAETEITKIATASDKQIYLSLESSEDTRIYDEAVFNEIDNFISNLKSNKILFIHLQGTHLYYKNRYPKKFNIFKDKPKNTIFDTKKINTIINQYDNAVLYNDYVVNGIIDKIKKTQTNSFVLYFSDHGEEVYNTIDFAGHNDDIGTLPMFQIPFVLWQSDLYKEQNDIEIDLNRPYMIDDLFHSIADLASIKQKDVNLSRSIFSKDFKLRKRVILDNKDYDSLLTKAN